MSAKTTAWKAAQAKPKRKPLTSYEAAFQKSQANRPSARKAVASAAAKVTKLVQIVPATGKMIVPRTYRATLINSNRRA